MFLHVVTSSFICLMLYVKFHVVNCQEAGESEMGTDLLNYLLVYKYMSLSSYLRCTAEEPLLRITSLPISLLYAISSLL